MGMLRSGLGSAFRAVANAFDPGAPRDMADPQYWADFGGRMSLAGVDVTDSNVSQLDAVQAVRHGLSSAMKSLPASVYRRGANGAREALPDHPVTRLFAANPNARQTPAELVGELAWNVSYYRNSYCAILPPGDPRASEYYAVGGLEWLHPRRLAMVERGIDGRLYYTFNPPPTIVQGAQLKQTTYRDDELWHIRSNPLREDGLLGEPIFHSARHVFARAIAVHDYGDLWFKNNGQSGGTLEHPGVFKDKEDRNQFLENWRAAGTGMNRHKDRLLTHGVKYNPIKVTNSEAQLLETEDAADTAVFGLWSYPLHRASRLKRATNNNVEQQSLDFVVGCVAPLAIELEQGVERDLLLDNENGDLFFEFNFFGLLRGDLLNRYRAYLIGRQGEWLSANDILRFENMSPRTDAGGNDYKNPLTKDSAGGGQGVDDKAGAGGGSSSPNEDGNND
ncbi:phage portal protein [Bradyrhizobium quebecense]|uniref:Phage portal protein n=1 Tax=Bradyrhizobium quebecense TaxID=2748629 RepID=A0A973WMW8_9BRAD|nr:phage portal protein [Bradyrhizobium quebecense]UGA46717.1 phage portal protein [Bradyrhizobium quebecense]